MPATTTYTFTTRQPDETLHRQQLDAKAEELGFDKFNRYDFDHYWKKQDGTEVMEGFFQRNAGSEKIHIVCLNPYKKEKADTRNFQLSINHD